MSGHLLNREKGLQSVRETTQWDLAIIGGGATGLGVAVDAASRGLKTILLEQADFAKGTSSRSTKLVHGGVRYLAQGDIKLVYGALRERGIIFRNAPHLAHAQSFIIPCYSYFDIFKYLIGLKIYDWMAGKYRIGKSRFVSKDEVSGLLPGVKTNRLKGGVEYYDGQFDDARLAINLAQTATAHQACLLNYCRVTTLTKDKEGSVTGLEFMDEETGDTHAIHARAVVNATGVFVDNILELDTPDHRPLVKPSQGTHVVVDRSFLGYGSALMIPETSDGRVLFGVPWHNHLVLGTTDTPLDSHSLEPRALKSEIDFILQTAGAYLVKQPTYQDVLSVFSGLRPLAAPAKNSTSTKEISRDHKLIVNPSGLITITGGKWTTYRKMAEETVDKAIELAGLPATACRTASIPIHGHTADRPNGHWSFYGSDAAGIKELASLKPEWSEKIHPDFEYILAEVVWAVRQEMARTVEDVLARRIRMLFLDADKAAAAARSVAQVMAEELNRDAQWIENQTTAFTKLAFEYLPEKSVIAT